MTISTLEGTQQGDPVNGRCLTAAELRDYILRAHQMATATYIQSDIEMRRRIGEMLDRAIESDDAMRGFLGRGGPLVGNDILGGAGSLETPNRGLSHSIQEN